LIPNISKSILTSSIGYGIKCSASMLTCSSRSSSLLSIGIPSILVIACDDETATAAALPLAPDFTIKLFKASATSSELAIAFSENAPTGRFTTPHATTFGLDCEPASSTSFIECVPISMPITAFDFGLNSFKKPP